MGDLEKRQSKHGKKDSVPEQDYLELLKQCLTGEQEAVGPR